MAEYTITISDKENGVSFTMVGPSPKPDSDAAKVAIGLIGVAKEVAEELARQRGEKVRGGCACDDCMTRKAAGEKLSGEVHAQPYGKHTIH